MKTILILRHAKSDWGDASLPDFERPLASRGLGDATRMGKVLAAFDLVPDKIIASPAQRAKQTTMLATEASGYQQAIEWESNFYYGGTKDVFDSLRKLPATVNRPMVVGHNPTLADVAAQLCHRDSIGPGEDFRLPTAGLVCFEVDIRDWYDLHPGNGTLRWFLIPRLVKAIRG